MRINILEEKVYENADWSCLKDKAVFVKGDCDVLCIGLENVIDNKFMKKFPSAKYILSPTTGIDHITTNKELTIISLNPKRIGDIRASSEFAFLLLLSLLRKMPLVASGCTNRYDLIGEDLYNKKVGILGYGRIGKNIKSYCSIFGANVMYHDINGGIEKKELLKFSDAIFVLVNGTPENTNYIDKKDFARMEKKPYFINISRANVVNDYALLEALENKTIRGAAVDMVNDKNVFSKYLKNNSNLIISPHIAGSSKDSQKKACNYVIKELAHVVSK